MRFLNTTDSDEVLITETPLSFGESNTNNQRRNMERNVENIWKEYPNLIGELPKDFYDSSWKNNEFPSYNHETNNFIVWVQDWDFVKERERFGFYVEYGYMEIRDDITQYEDEIVFQGFVKTWEEVLEHEDKWIKEYTKRFPNWKKEVNYD